jgi:hypothetical protein
MRVHPSAITISCYFQSCSIPKYRYRDSSLAGCIPNCRRFPSLRGTKQSTSAVIARYEAIHFRRHCEIRSNPLPPSLRGTKQSTSAVIARYEAIQGARSGLLHPPGSQGRPVMTILKYTRIHHGTQGVAAGYKTE